MATMKLTKRNIDALATAKSDRGDLYFDSEIKGFGLAVYPSGKKSFFILYGPSIRRRRMVLGQYGKLSPDTARDMAQKKLFEVLQGQDPLEQKQARRKAITFQEWASEYYESVKLRKKHPEEDKRYLGWASKRWGKKPLDQVTAEDISRLYHEKATEGKVTAANRFHASVSACLQTAWRLGKIESNPALKVVKLPDPQPRDRVMSEVELAKMLQAIENLPDPHLRAGFLLLIHTGARRSEVLNAKWQDFDFEAKVWRLPSTKSGRIQYIPITQDLADMLLALPRYSDYLLPGLNAQKRRFDLNRPWRHLQQETGLTDLHIHDLRRSFGLAIARQAGLHVASRLLRHSNVSITAAVYAPLGLDDLRNALEERGKVIPLRPKASGEKK